MQFIRHARQRNAGDENRRIAKFSKFPSLAIGGYIRLPAFPLSFLRSIYVKFMTVDITQNKGNMSVINCLYLLSLWIIFDVFSMNLAENCRLLAFAIVPTVLWLSYLETRRVPALNKDFQNPKDLLRSRLIDRTCVRYLFYRDFGDSVETAV